MRQCTCDMKGFLSFLIIWELRKESRNGSELAEALEKRRGNKPTPGTIYPALKELVKKGLIVADKDKRYSLSAKGKKELELGVRTFCAIFSDYGEMQSCCKR